MLPPAPLLQALLGDSGGQNWGTGTTDKYGRLDRELQLANSHFIEEQQAQQQVPRWRTGRWEATHHPPCPASQGSVANGRQDGPELAPQLPESICVMVAYIGGF